MPDITVCATVGCPLERTCYRHEASGTKPTPRRQSYADFSPGVGVPCENYWGPVPYDTDNTGGSNA